MLNGAKFTNISMHTCNWLIYIIVYCFLDYQDVFVPHQRATLRWTVSQELFLSMCSPHVITDQIKMTCKCA